MIATAEVKQGNVMDVLQMIEKESVHLVVTSPPYWGLRDYKTPGQHWGGSPSCTHKWAERANSKECRRCGAWFGSLGLEPTIDQYIGNLVSVFRAVRRVLRDDGTCWVNLGDSYSSGGRDSFGPGTNKGQPKDAPRAPQPDGLKPLDLCNIPHRFAAAMQADGWYWRSSIVWAKGVSLQKNWILQAITALRAAGVEDPRAYAALADLDLPIGSSMPESMQGTRWEQHRIKIDDCLFDCPGCDKCNDNEGLVLKHGSWRPSNSYELIFQFAKSPRYFADMEAVREEESATSHGGNSEADRKLTGSGNAHRDAAWHDGTSDSLGCSSSRNPRSVWVINPQPFPGAHFAVFPEALVEPIIKVGTSEKGVCPECGAPWARIVEAKRVATRPTETAYKDSAPEANKDHGRHVREAKTLGWRPTCGCPLLRDSENSAGPPVPAMVLDPFVGSGTTCLVARKLGRNSIGIELSQEYAKMAKERIEDYAPLFA